MHSYITFLVGDIFSASESYGLSALPFLQTLASALAASTIPLANLFFLSVSSPMLLMA